MDAPDFDRSRAMWRTSSYTNNGGACVEVADNLPGLVAVCDSKDHNGPVVVLSPAQWREFTAGIRAGELSAGCSSGRPACDACKPRSAPI